MVKGYDAVSLTPTQRVKIQAVHTLAQEIEDEGFMNREARALTSIINHLSEGYILDPGYLTEKMSLLFPECTFKVKSY